METKMKVVAIECLAFLWLLINAEADQGGVLKAFLNARRANRIDNATWLSESKISVDEKDGFNVYLLESQNGLQQKDRIQQLPGQPPNVSFAQYSGYVTVDPKAGRALFYYFTEATQNASFKPLLLWLNGGPGCSSLGYGAMQELGPFRVKSDGKTLYRNKYSWNRVANVLFLESPAGVGFSYSKNSSDYDKSGDRRTADDSYIFVLNWLERFPQYKSRPFYIAGESYAGNYVPELAETIVRHNNGSKNPVINLKGIMVGNGVINDETDARGEYEYGWTHALISDETWASIQNACNFSSGNYFSVECDSLLNFYYSSLGNIDIYNIYAPLCAGSTPPSTKSEDYAHPLKASGFDPCSENYVHAYLNLPEVQKALHANVTGLPYPWDFCSSIIKWQDSSSSMLPVYNKLMATGLRIWIYSGDMDARVPVTSTRYSINKLNLTITTPWYPWIRSDIEVGGYSVIYKGLTFATVRGAGHMVPSDQSARALTLVRSFLSGTPLKSEF